MRPFHDNRFAAAMVIALMFLATTTLSYASELVVYSEGFETDNGGYTVAPSSAPAEWEWGTPGGSVGPSAAHSGNRVWGTDLDDTLARTSDGSIISPPIPIPSVTADEIIRIRFWAYLGIDGMYDRGEFFVSPDGTSWQSLAEFFQDMDRSGGGTQGWQKFEFTLDPSYGGGDVYLRFRAAVPYSRTTFFCGGGDRSLRFLYR